MNRRTMLNALAALIAAPAVLRKTALAMPVREVIASAPSLIRASTRSGIPMASLKVTTWRPDTCECEIDYAWDRNAPADTRQHVPVSAKCCRHHACYTNAKDAYVAVSAENQGKNRAVAAEATARGVDPHTVRWAFDHNRSLTLEA